MYEWVGFLLDVEFSGWMYEWVDVLLDAEASV
jgi:hypothetical protein